MKNYEIEQSNNEIQQVYSQLLDKLTEHVKLLSLNSKPITSVMAMKRALIRIKIGYQSPATIKGIILNEEEEKLATEILECLGIDIKQAVNVRLIGIKEMKRTLIRHHYEKMAKGEMKYKEIKEELSKKYGLSVANIEKMVYRNARGVESRKAGSTLRFDMEPENLKSGNDD